MYDHFIALDWAQRNMAIARMTHGTDRVIVTEAPSDVGELKLYLGRLKGRKVLTFEETTTAQWLYTELKPYVSDVVVCDPYRNKLLSEGAKNDRIDATKLVKLLKANLVKPVFHSGNEFIGYRKVISAYEDLVKAGVRLKNQRSALFRAKGLSVDERELDEPAEQFVLVGLDESIASYELQKKRYEKQFALACREQPMLKNLLSIPGIGEIGAYKIAATVVDARRFPTRGHFIAYCGLIRFEKLSGGVSYGTRKPRYSRMLKCVFKTAAMSVITHGSSSQFGQYYDYLIREKNYPQHNARHAVARRIAVIAYGVMKSGRRYEPIRLKSDPA